MQTAELLGIHRTTLRNWKLTHDEIRRLYQSDGQDGDEERKKQVEEALLKRAIEESQLLFLTQKEIEQRHLLLHFQKMEKD